MGVDFKMQAVRPRPDGGFDPIQGEGFESSTRLLFLETLLRPGHQEGSPAQLLRSLLTRPVSFRWFEGCYAGAYREAPPPSTGDCSPPQEIMDCLRAVLETLRDRADAFPPLYVLREERTGEAQGGWKAVYQGRVYDIRGGWNRCDAIPAEADPHIPYPRGVQIVDLRGFHAVRCRPITFGGLAPGRVGDVLRPETTLLIETESCQSLFGSTLEAMMSVAARAETTGAVVFTSLR